jgi:hypothetical protein
MMEKQFTITATAEELNLLMSLIDAALKGHGVTALKRAAVGVAVLERAVEVAEG